MLALGEGARVQVLAPVVRGRKGEYQKELDAFRRQGFVRVRIDGALHDLGDEIAMARTAKHDVDVVVDRIAVRETARARIAESLETALRLADGLALVDVGPGREEWLFSAKNACADCGVSFPEIEPRFFSFNNPHGACPACAGLGTRDVFDPARVVPDPSRPLAMAIEPWNAGGEPSRYYAKLLDALAAHFGVSLDTPCEKLPARARATGSCSASRTKSRIRVSSAPEELESLARTLGRRARRARAPQGRVGRRADAASRHRDPCPDCEGSRLRPEARSVRIGGVSHRRAVAARRSPRPRASSRSLELPEGKRVIAERVAAARSATGCASCSTSGLDYLTLDRAARHALGRRGAAHPARDAGRLEPAGRALRARRAVDRPAPARQPRLLETLFRLRDLGNSVLVVEHDEETIRSADCVIDMGPGAGIHGGRIVAEGPLAEILATPGLADRRLPRRPPRDRRAAAAPQARRPQAGAARLPRAQPEARRPAPSARALRRR